MVIELIESEIGKFMDFLIEQSREELRQQGHVATGKSLQQITRDVYASLSSNSGGRIYVPDHLMILDRGVRASRVPYGRGGKDSKYIRALIDWLAKVRGGDLKSRKKIAFAIAATAKRTGHPTPGSYRHSSNGRRKNWSQHAIQNNLDKARQYIDFVKILQAIIDENVRQLKAA